MNKVLEGFARQLRKIREGKGISQEELSGECGFDRTYVGKIERAEKSPSLDTVYKLADHLDINMEDLFTDID